MHLKRWESPRREGRNDKGKGGAARQRQLKKQTQMLRKKLKLSKTKEKKKGEGTTVLFSFCLGVFLQVDMGKNWLEKRIIKKR